MTRDIFQHHDRIVDHKAGGDGHRHQRQIVEAVTSQPHDAEGADQGHRHRHCRNQHGAEIAQKQKHHHDHQRNRNQQGAFDFPQAGANRRSALHHHLQIDRCRYRRAQFRQQGLHPIHGVDNVGIRLAVDQHDHRRLAVGGAVVAQVLN